MERKMRKINGDASWFMRDRFGMFIHFGLYSIPARNEHIKRLEFMSDEKYHQYFEIFNPDMLDMKEWAKSAKNAGMKYAVLTTKHHDGFCLFDSQYTEYKSTNTPCKRDIVREFVDAFRQEGIRVGFYYSLIDWIHPDFTVDRYHPRRKDAPIEELNKNRNMKKYAEYMRNQVRELLTNYGQIDILWLDFSYTETEDEKGQLLPGKGKEDWESDKLIALARLLQPQILINNRAGVEADIWTPEQYQAQNWLRHKETGEYLVWEACHTFSGSWGYHRDEMTWKSPSMLIEILINTVSLGGNLIMNVGPTARGYFDERAEKALNVYSDWMKFNSSSIYNCTMADDEFVAPKGCRLTQSIDKKKLYIHLMEYPYKFLEIHNMAGKVKLARFLHDGSEIVFDEGKVKHFGVGLSEADDLVVLKIPQIAPKVVVPVIELILK